MSSDTSEEVMDVEDLDDGAPTKVKGEGESDDAKSDDEDATEALDELEAEELEMLTEDESNEAIVVDEAAEMRAIRRAEIAMEAGEVDEAASDEFVCTKCFLVKSHLQLAAKRKKICLDCAS
ncbi:MAG: DUF4193 domain-containing protein [Actinomycetia bacterium]|nr:DUF4193 domain-containing protein [Actinomycetes bacterium]